MLILFLAETMALIVQHRVPQAIHMCAAAAKPASAMRVKELKEELDLLGVEWRGVIFDKETLEQALDKARQLPPPQQPFFLLAAACARRGASLGCARKAEHTRR